MECKKTGVSLSHILLKYIIALISEKIILGFQTPYFASINTTNITLLFLLFSQLDSVSNLMGSNQVDYCSDSHLYPFFTQWNKTGNNSSYFNFYWIIRFYIAINKGRNGLQSVISLTLKVDQYKRKPGPEARAKQ